eukprot:g12967.t1
MARPGKKLRNYQSRIASTCERFNTIVVLPTGSGKTLIAAEVIKRLPPPALFLVPTRLLVEQQAEALRVWNPGRDVAEYSGGMALPASFHVFVSTPEAFKIAQRSSSLLNWNAFGVVVFDEVHHVLKDHPYRKLALSLRRASLFPSSSSPMLGNTPRVVGLTASYSYAVGHDKTKTSLTRMCRELRITNTETATAEELEASGYHAKGAMAEVSLSGPAPSAHPCSAPTARATSKNTTSTPKGVVPEADRKPHKMVTTFFDREQRGASTAFSRLLMVCVRSMEKVIVTGNISKFQSPMPPTGKLAPREWGAYAHKLSKCGGPAQGGPTTAAAARRCIRCGVNSTCEEGAGRGGCDSRHRHLSYQPDVRVLLAELEHWYEAVKTLVVSWEEGEDEAATILDMFGCTESPSFNGSEQKQGIAWPTHVLQKIRAFWAGVPASFPRYEHLKDVLVEKYKYHGGDGGGDISSNGRGKSFRGIVFVRQRVTTHALAHVIASDPRLAPHFSTSCLYASSSAATASLYMTKAQAQASIRAFRSGTVNLLLATVVAEEGMDIPKANCVIRYDAMEHAVSLVQGRGRAREGGSSFVVLRERSDRSTADLEAVERQQQRFVKKFKPLAEGSAAAAAADEALAAAQRSREKGARVVLLATAASDGGGALSAVNLFCKKTKVVLEDDWNKVAGELWACTLSYESPLRKLAAVGTAPSKKAAKKLAAARLLTDLRAAVPA